MQTPQHVPALLAPTTVATLQQLTTATISAVLFKKGLRNVWIRGAIPLSPDQPRISGRAFTMRFVPMREDLANPQAWPSPRLIRVAVEQMPPDYVAVVDAMGSDAGTFGNILCARMRVRGVAGLVTDGVVRDIPGVRASGLPAAVASLTFVRWEDPITCGGVAVSREPGPCDVVHLRFPHGRLAAVRARFAQRGRRAVCAAAASTRATAGSWPRSRRRACCASASRRLASNLASKGRLRAVAAALVEQPLVVVAQQDACVVHVFAHQLLGARGIA